MKDGLFTRSMTGYYPVTASTAEVAYHEAIAASEAAGRQQVDAWYSEQAAPVVAELHEMVGAPEAVPAPDAMSVNGLHRALAGAQ